MTEVQTLVECHNCLGEGPSYDDKNDLLYWVNIFEKEIFRYDFTTGKVEKRTLPKYVGYIAPTEKKDIVLVGLQDGVYLYDFGDSTLSFIGGPVGHDPLTYRFNDGKCDAKGRVWAGTASWFEERFDSSLYRVEGGAFTPMLSGVNVSNGLGWTADNKHMFYIDSGKYTVYKFDFDLEFGMLSNKRVLIDFKDQHANPDGMTVDIDGNLWIANWGGSKVSQWNGETGEKMREIAFPVKRVTCPVFAGKDYSKLVVTTATYGLSAEELEAEPDAGNVFIVDAGVKGFKTNFYAL